MLRTEPPSKRVGVLAAIGAVALRGLDVRIVADPTLRGKGLDPSRARRGTRRG